MKKIVLGAVLALGFAAPALAADCCEKKDGKMSACCEKHEGNDKQVEGSHEGHEKHQ